jgi:hypothetical protein
MLARLYDAHQGERKLRGLIIVSDGADNGTTHPTLAEAAKWRGIGCPIYCFGVGQQSTKTDQKDIAITSIAPDPSPVPIKADLTVRGVINAQGFEGANVKVRLLIDDKLVKTQSVQLLKSAGNEVEIVTKAPDKPGEVKVTLEIGTSEGTNENEPLKPLPGEVSDLNNRIETYLTVTREGVRVLYIDVLRPEGSWLRSALGSDKRFDLVYLNQQTDAPLPAAEAKKVDLGDQAYDVIILGDVSADRLKAIRPKFADQISDLVRERALGLLMFGGQDSFAGTRNTPGFNKWIGSPIAKLLPVEIDKPSDGYEMGEEVREPTEMRPTVDGWRSFILRLAATPEENKKVWDRLNDPRCRLNGFTPMGPAKVTAQRLAVAVVKGRPAVTLLAGHDVGKGRVLAFGGDSTANSWRQLGKDNPKNPKEGLELNARFWKQMVLWLAHQDEVEGSVYARPDYRRLAVNGKQTIRMGVRDKRGDDIANATLQYQIVAPNEKEDKSKAVRADRDGRGQHRAIFESRKPGEYQVVVWGQGKDPDGVEISDRAAARFVVYPEVSDELLRPAANPDFLSNLENTTNGTNVDFRRRADDLPAFLEDMKAHPLRPAGVKPKYYPDWRRNANKWFLPTVLLLFVSIIGMEWGLRRLWGMV